MKSPRFSSRSSLAVTSAFGLSILLALGTRFVAADNLVPYKTPPSGNVSPTFTSLDVTGATKVQQLLVGNYIAPNNGNTLALRGGNGLVSLEAANVNISAPLNNPSAVSINGDITMESNKVPVGVLEEFLKGLTGTIKNIISPSAITMASNLGDAAFTSTGISLTEKATGNGGYTKIMPTSISVGDGVNPAVKIDANHIKFAGDFSGDDNDKKSLWLKDKDGVNLNGTSIMPATSVTDKKDSLYPFRDKPYVNGALGVKGKFKAEKIGSFANFSGSGFASGTPLLFPDTVSSSCPSGYSLISCTGGFESNGYGGNNGFYMSGVDFTYIGSSVSGNTCYADYMTLKKIEPNTVPIKALATCFSPNPEN